MTDLALTAADIAVVFPNKADILPVTLAAAVTKGQTLYKDANGKGNLADGNASGAQQTRLLALQAGGAGDVINALKEGHVFGFTITQAYDAPLFQSDTAGAIGDSNGTLEVPVGLVDGIDRGGTITKVVYFAPRWGADYS